ncbi:MAG TPA: PIG-L family deacetylase [Terriglobia bacterium]|nr:PIG-L family deacetylase [Terriglobia bacterium]
MVGQVDTWSQRRDRWLQYLNEVTGAVDCGKAIPLGPSPSPLSPPPVTLPASAGKVVYCAPHPDDECLSGALAFRLRNDSGARITNVAITLGSDKEQRPRRLRELESACHAAGFELVVPQHPSGFDHVTQLNRKEKAAEWSSKVTALREIFDRENPDAILTPHALDFNTTHVGTHWLVADALAEHLERTKREPALFIETEFWHQIERPNLMLGIAPELVAAQLVAVAEHGREMARNPYHLLHPCRLMDNVRRGSEVVGGQGAAAREFSFAEIYNVAFMKGREIVPAKTGGCIIDPNVKIDLQWLKAQFSPQA